MAKHEAGAAAAASETVHTLESLGSALGAATLEEAQTLTAGYGTAALVKEGSAVATPRISTDAARLYGQAFDFLGRGTDEQLDQLPAFTKEWLRIAVWTAGEGDRRFNLLSGHNAGEKAKQAASGAQSSALQAQAEAKRDQLHSALIALAGGDASLVAQVASTYGTVADLAGAITGQTALARAWLAKPPAKMANRLKTSRLNAAWLAKADAIAAEFGKVSRAAGATRNAASLSTADVDHVDGINLILLRSLAAQFEAGHAADPTIPRLTFNSLRPHVQRSHHGAPTEPGPTDPVAPATS